MNSRVEIYRSDRQSLKNVPCDCPDSVLIYKNVNHKAWGHLESLVVREWRWRLRAGNGKILSQSSEAYNDPRDLVHGLELSFPGYVLQHLVHGWALCYDLEWVPTLYPLARERAPRIPVRVPKGTENRWAARRKR